MNVTSAFWEGLLVLLLINAGRGQALQSNQRPISEHGTLKLATEKIATSQGLV